MKCKYCGMEDEEIEKEQERILSEAQIEDYLLEQAREGNLE